MDYTLFSNLIPKMFINRLIFLSSLINMVIESTEILDVLIYQVSPIYFSAVISYRVSIIQISLSIFELLCPPMLNTSVRKDRMTGQC